LLEGPAFDRQGHLWVTGLQTGAAIRVTPDGQCTAVAKPGTAINGSKFDAQGGLILTDAEKGLMRFDTVTSNTKRGKHGREMFRGFNDSAIEKSGGIYFTESWGSNVLMPDGRVFNLAANDVEASARDAVLVANGVAFPNGPELSADEKDLYVFEYAQNQIPMLPLSGPRVVGAHSVLQVSARLTGGTGPDGMPWTRRAISMPHIFAPVKSSSSIATATFTSQKLSKTRSGKSRPR
jgi:gluconolactonase